MFTVLFISSEGDEQRVEADEGVSIMKAATDNGVSGIIGDCGGNLSCATCHAYISPEWRAKIADPEELELEMLECALDVTEDSRLTCQIEMRAELDGIVVTVPPSF